jgi:hypothetical protein
MEVINFSTIKTGENETINKTGVKKIKALSQFGEIASFELTKKINKLPSNKTINVNVACFHEYSSINLILLLQFFSF